MPRERIRLFANKLLDWMVEPPPEDFPAALSVRSENTPQVSPAKLLITVLIIFCAIPRLLMMWRIDAVCNDAYYYISIADLLDRGQFEDAFRYLNLNVYPAVLLLFHKLGLDWVTGGQLWGVFVSSLIVAPMFGWIRYAFNKKVAIVSCFLYAIQPELIEISAEPIREPMFWFFFNLCLYFAWRSVTSAKWWMFMASGLSFTLASYTRSEGWLLLLPILLWPLICRAESWFVRARLMAGTCLSLAVIPTLLVVVNVTLLHGHDHWEWGRSGNFRSGWKWLSTETDAPVGPTPTQRKAVGSVSVIDANKVQAETAAGGESSNVAAAVLSHGFQLSAINSIQDGGTKNPIASANFALNILPQHTTQLLASSETSNLSAIRDYLDDLLNSLGLTACVLLMTGLFGWRHLLKKREYIVFFMMAICVFLGIWMKLRFSGGINGRYFFTGWFVLVPFESLGFLAIAHRISRLRRPGWLAQRGRTVVGGIVIVMALVSCGDAITSSHKSRQRQASLGRWLNAEYGPFDTVMVDTAATRIGYYSRGTIPGVCYNLVQFSERLDQQQPTLIIHSEGFRDVNDDSYERDSANLKHAYRVPPSILHPHDDGFVIYIRNQAPRHTIQSAPGGLSAKH